MDPGPAGEPTKIRATRVDREAAFAFWAALPPEQRRYAVVAEKFDVSPRTPER
jgi:hypothetical protein